MEPIIRPAGPADIGAVTAFLNANMDPRIPRDRWARIMTYDWRCEKPDLGRVVEADGRILGFLGLIYADRWARGRRERVVNVCAWYLDKSMRGRGLGAGMARSALADADATFTVLTPSRRAIPVFEALGFRTLDDHQFTWRRRGASGPAIELSRDRDTVRAALGAAQRRLLDDHDAMPVTPILASRGDARCLLVFSIKKKGADITHYDVLHAGDAGFLGRFGQAIADAVLPDGQAILAADCRLAADAAEGAERTPLPMVRYYRSSRLERRDIDHLYSELQLLDLKLD